MFELLDFLARAALGIGIGATLAAVASQTPFAGTVGLAGTEHIATNTAIVSAVVWSSCRLIGFRRP
jgi:hypothetical protein